MFAAQSVSGAADGLGLSLVGARVVARPSGALFLPEARILAAADLHLGKCARAARFGGALLPPYETAATLDRLAAEIDALRPETVLCVGDSFDSADAAEALAPGDRRRLAALAAGRRWVWLAGNHDPSPPDAPGEWAERWEQAGLVFVHEARAGDPPGAVSGHHHPKAQLWLKGRRIVRRCFLHDRRRLILPAFGAYAGGLDAADPIFDALLEPEARALMLGPRLIAAPRAALTDFASRM
ncbi:MAG: ligase-associated DNA damage response endonuclease PdeM [Rubrimonas sp.]|uniref:ligase-associated DNA damage response endonuclease PdeM n=1 Tax=Rubrimonas sp. TaxID=2036015 RepID=UPI002FDDAC51